MNSVFDYTDFRLFMQDTLVAKKKENASFTHRFVCSSLGLKTSNFILLVIQAKRNLNSELAERFADLIGLNSQEREYFQWCVLLGQATTALEKHHYWHQMELIRTGATTRHLQTNQYDYYRQWYHPVIRELVVMGDRQWDAKSLAKYLRPKVSVVQVRHSLQLLESLNLIRKVDGSWEKVDTDVGTPAEVRSVAVFDYQRALMDIAKDSLENDPGDIRNFSTVTLEMNENEYGLVLEMLTQFRRSALAVSGSSGPSDRVYQMNLQLFPVSKVVSSGDSQTDVTGEDT